MDITKAQFWNTPNVAGRESFSYAQLLAQLTADLPGGAGNIGKGVAVLQSFGGTVYSTGITTLIDWDLFGASNVLYDDLGFYTDAASTRFTIPDIDPPIQRVQSYCTGSWSGAGSGVNTIRRLFTELNNDNGSNQLMARQEQGPVPVSGVGQFVMSNWTPVVPGDFFEFSVLQNGGGGVSFRQVSGGLIVVQ